MAPIWLNALAKMAREIRGEEKQEGFALDLGINRQQISLIENAKANSGIVYFLAILANDRGDPIERFLGEVWDSINAINREDKKALYALLEALKDEERRGLALDLVRALRKRPSVADKDEEAGGPAKGKTSTRSGAG